MSTTMTNPVGAALSNTLRDNAMLALLAIREDRERQGLSVKDVRYRPVNLDNLTREEFDTMLRPIFDWVRHYFLTIGAQQPDGSYLYHGTVGEPIRALLAHVEPDAPDSLTRATIGWVSASIRNYGFARQINGGPSGGDWRLEENWDWENARPAGRVQSSLYFHDLPKPTNGNATPQPWTANRQGRKTYRGRPINGSQPVDISPPEGDMTITVDPNDVIMQRFAAVQRVMVSLSNELGLLRDEIVAERRVPTNKKMLKQLLVDLISDELDE